MMFFSYIRRDYCNNLKAKNQEDVQSSFAWFSDHFYIIKLALNHNNVQLDLYFMGQWMPLAAEKHEFLYLSSSTQCIPLSLLCVLWKPR